MTEHELQKTLDEYVHNRRTELATRGKEIHELMQNSLAAVNELKKSCKAAEPIKPHSNVWQQYLCYVDGVLQRALTSAVI